MTNFIADSADQIVLNSMANVFMEKLDPVGKEDSDIDNDGDSDKSDSYLRNRRKNVGAAIAADKAKRVKKEEIEVSLRGKVGALTEKKLYKSEKATYSDEKEIEISEKPVKNKVTINPDMQESKGLWDNIHAKRKRGEKPAKKGDKDYPKTLNVEGVVNEAGGVASSQRRPSSEEDKSDPGYKMSSYDRQVKRFGIRQPSEVPDAPRYGERAKPKTKAVSKDAKKAAPSASITGNKASSFMNPGASKAFDSSKSSTTPKFSTTPKLNLAGVSSPTDTKDILKYLKSMQKEQTTDYRASMAADAAAARTATRARAEKNMKRLEANGGAVQGIKALVKKAGLDFKTQKGMNSTANPGIFKSDSSIEADKPLQQRLGELPSSKKRAQVDAARTKSMMAAPIPTSTPKTPKTPKITEEASDAMKDRRMERGGVDGNNRYNKAPGKPNTFGKKKRSFDGPSAMDAVKAKIRAKYGDKAIVDTKKKKEEYLDEMGKSDAAVRSRMNIRGYEPPTNWDKDANRGKGATVSPKQAEKRRRKSLRQEKEED